MVPRASYGQSAGGVFAAMGRRVAHRNVHPADESIPIPPSGTLLAKAGDPVTFLADRIFPGQIEKLLDLVSISGRPNRLPEERDLEHWPFKERTVKFLCFGYLDVENWAKKSPSEQNAMIDECFAYDEALQKSGHWVGGEGLQGPNSAATLRYQNGRVSVTDGPYAETKEQLGGLLILEASDLHHAAQLVANHPGIKMGPWEIRPAFDLSTMIAESKQRRLAQPGS